MILMPVTLRECLKTEMPSRIFGLERERERERELTGGR
jgi:hypothetical protein